MTKGASTTVILSVLHDNEVNNGTNSNQYSRRFVGCFFMYSSAIGLISCLPADICLNLTV